MKNQKTLALLMAATVAVGSGHCVAEQIDTANLEKDTRFTPVPERNDDGNYNILFVTTDQEHYFAEYPDGTEYQARKLLEELGTTFEKHYTCSNMSTSSRSVMYTGTHITDTGMLDNTDFPWQDQLPEDKVTLGDRLREAGLYTAYKGKWHMGNTSTLFAAESTLSDLEQHGFSDWNQDKDYVGEALEGYIIDPMIVGDSVAWLRDTGMTLNQNGQSFFLAVNLINPHDIMNLVTDDDFAGGAMAVTEPPKDKVYEKSYNLPLPSTWQQDIATDGTVYGVNAYKNTWFSNMGDIDDHHFVKMQDYYFNCIQDSDNNLMNLLIALDHMHMLDNTIIVFTSDHGEMHGAHGLKGKGGFIYEENIHVPMIIYHPDYEGGRRIDAVTSHLDLVPTFIDMTSISEDEKARLSEGLNGHSMMALMDGSAENIRDGALFCFEMISMTMATSIDENGTPSVSLDNRCFVRAIVTEDYKFARYFSPLNFNTPETIEALFANNDVELYDLNNDPEDMNNLAMDPEKNADLIMEMNTKLNALIAAEIGVDDGSELAPTLNGFGEKLKLFLQLKNGQ